MNYDAVVKRLFGRTPVTTFVTEAARDDLSRAAVEAGAAVLADFGDAPRAVARLADNRFAAIGKTHAALLGAGDTCVSVIGETEQEKDPPASVRELTPVEKKNAREHVKRGRKAFRFGRFKPGMAVTWNGERWIVYDARARGGSRFTLMLVSPDYERLADEVQPSELGESETTVEVKESQSFTPAHLEQLRAQFAQVKTVDPSSPTYDKMIKLLDGMSQHQLKQVAGANIKFLSKLAFNRVKKAEAVDEARVRRVLWSMKVGGNTWGAVAFGPHFFATFNGEDYDFDDGEVQDLPSGMKAPPAVVARLEKSLDDFGGDKETARESMQEAESFGEAHPSNRPNARISYNGHAIAVWAKGTKKTVTVDGEPIEGVFDDLESAISAGKSDIDESGPVSEAGDLESEIDRVQRDLDYVRADYRAENDSAKKRKLKTRMDKLDARFEELLAQRKAGASGDGKWRTTKSGHKIYIDGDGDVTKGNPHVIGKAKESVDEAREPMDDGEGRPGDKVVVIGNVAGRNKRGKITSIAPSGSFATVQFANGEERSYHLSDLSLVAPFGEAVAEAGDDEIDRAQRDLEYARADARDPDLNAKAKAKLQAKVAALDAKLSKLLAARKGTEKSGGDGDGKWRTTPSGHKIYIDGDGKVTKGNPHVLKAGDGADAKGDSSSKSDVPAGWHAANGMKEHPVPKKGKPIGWKATPDSPAVVGYASKGKQVYALVKGADGKIGMLTAGRVKESVGESWRMEAGFAYEGKTVMVMRDQSNFAFLVDGELIQDGFTSRAAALKAAKKHVDEMPAMAEAKAKHAYAVGDRVEVHGEGKGKIVRVRRDSANAYEVSFDKGGTKVVWDNPDGAAAVGYRKITRVEGLDEAMPAMKRGQVWTLSYSGPADDPDLWLFVTGSQRDGTPEGVQYDVSRGRATMQSFRGYNGKFTRQDADAFVEMFADQPADVNELTARRRVVDTLARHGALKLFPGVAESVEEARANVAGWSITVGADRASVRSPDGDFYTADVGQDGAVEVLDSDDEPAQVPGAVVRAIQRMLLVASEGIVEAKVPHWRDLASELLDKAENITRETEVHLRVSPKTWDLLVGPQKGEPVQRGVYWGEGTIDPGMTQDDAKELAVDLLDQVRGMRQQDEGVYNANDPTPFDSPDVVKAKLAARDAEQAQKKREADAARAPAEKLAGMLTPDERRVLGVTIGYIPAARRKQSKLSSDAYDAAVAGLKAKGVFSAQGALRMPATRAMLRALDMSTRRELFGEAELPKRDQDAIAKMAPGAIKQAQIDKARRDAHYAKPATTTVSADWDQFEGVLVMRRPGSQFVAVPVTGKKSSKLFDVIRVEGKREHVAQVKSAEVGGFLARLDRTDESVDEVSYGGGVTVTLASRGGREKLWTVRKDGVLLGYVTKFTDTRASTNPWKAFRYENPTSADTSDNPKAEFLGTTYQGKLQGAVDAVLSGKKLVQDTPESVEEGKSDGTGWFEDQSDAEAQAIKWGRNGIAGVTLNTGTKGGFIVLTYAGLSRTSSDDVLFVATRGKTYKGDEASDFVHDWFSRDSRKRERGVSAYGPTKLGDDLQLPLPGDDAFRAMFLGEFGQVEEAKLVWSATVPPKAQKKGYVANPTMGQAPLTERCNRCHYADRLGDPDGKQVKCLMFRFLAAAEGHCGEWEHRGSPYAKKVAIPREGVEEGYQHVHFEGSKSARAKTVMAGGKTKSVQGRTFDGVLLVHPTGNYQWGVTHIPTGFGLVPPPGFSDDREAVKFARAASALGGWDFTDPQAMPPELPSKMSSLIAAFRPHIRKTGGNAYESELAGQPPLFEVDLRCPNCGENLGKDTENPKKAWCGNCSTRVNNPRGYTPGKDESVDEAKSFKISTKDPATMTPAEINREKDKLSAASSELTDKFIEMGRGNWRQSDIRAEAEKGDELSKLSVAITSRQQDLTIEIEARYGPNAPSRLPLRKGFGPRKKAVESTGETVVEGFAELLRASRETSDGLPRLVRAWTDDGKVLEKRGDRDWTVSGTIKAGLLGDSARLRSALESTRSKLEAAGWTIESFNPPA